MKLYHGGLVEIQVPCIIVGDHIGDFGVGFIPRQASSRRGDS